MANELTINKFGGCSIIYDAGSDCGPIAGLKLTGGVPVEQNGIKFVRFETKYKGQTVQAKYDTRPDLAKLVEEYKDYIAKRSTEREAKWAAEQAEQDAIDKPLLEAMHKQAAEFKAQIPADHLEVTITQTGDLDGYPILDYTVDGVKVTWQDVNYIGTASAIRPGAMGAFAIERICSISKDKLEQIKAAQQAAADTQKAVRDARQNELMETAIPAEALSAYEYYQGDSEKAWEKEDETSWALINRWTPFIEKQYGMHHGKLKRLTDEYIKELNYGILD